LKADLQRIQAVPFPAAHCRAKAAREIEALAEGDKVSVDQLVGRAEVRT
jgi:hypothetical protein